MMDDDRIERALRHGPPNDPRFEPSGRWLDAVPAAELTPDRRPRPEMRLFAGLAAIAAVILVAVVVAGPLSQLREQGVGGLIGEVERRGAIRVALDGSPPQAFTASGGYDGFDIDVAHELADRLGVRLDILLVPRAEILAGEASGDWDVAISSVSDALPLGPAAQTTEPYAVVTGALAVAEDDTASTPDDLDGMTLCVVSGSTAEAWANGSLLPEDGLLSSPPADADVTTRTTAQECVAAMADGTARAVVVDRESDVSAGGGLRFLAPAPFESRLIAVVDGRAGGAATLVARLNQLFAGMAADGSIREFGQRRFAGDDVTPPTD
jgi:polar amino acid transport system substrate-binding protein